MNPIGLALGKNMAAGSLNNIKSSMITQEGAYPAIKWDDFNYPPLLKLIHYDLNELQDPHRSLVKKMNISLLLVFVATILNFISNIIQVIMIGHAMRIFYSIMNIILFNPPALYVFYKGYKGIVADESQLRMYKILQGVLGLTWLIWSIIGAGAFDGWVRVAYLFNNGAGFPGFLAVAESLIYLGNCILAFLCVYLTHRFDGNAKADKA